MDAVHCSVFPSFCIPANTLSKDTWSNKQKIYFSWNGFFRYSYILHNLGHGHTKHICHTIMNCWSNLVPTVLNFEIKIDYWYFKIPYHQVVFCFLDQTEYPKCLNISFISPPFLNNIQFQNAWLRNIISEFCSP